MSRRPSPVTARTASVPEPSSSRTSSGQGLPVVDGRMTRPVRPGLGVTLDAEAVSGRPGDAVIDPLITVAEHRPEAAALRDSSGQWTWRQVLAHASSLAQRLGPAVGGRAALLARDTRDAVMAIHAARLAGATLVPLNRRLTRLGSWHRCSAGRGSGYCCTMVRMDPL